MYKRLTRGSGAKDIPGTAGGEQWMMTGGRARLHATQSQIDKVAARSDRTRCWAASMDLYSTGKRKEYM